jgi:hypothetical protein
VVRASLLEDLEVARVEQARSEGEVQAVIREAARPAQDDAERALAASGAWLAGVTLRLTVATPLGRIRSSRDFT